MAAAYAAARAAAVLLAATILDICFFGRVALPNDVLIHFATNRNKTDDALMFGFGFAEPNNPSFVVYGRVRATYDVLTSTWKPDPSSLQIDPPPTPAAALASHTSSTAPSPAAPAAAVPGAVKDFVSNVNARHAMAASTAPKTAPGLIFVHGFNTTFVDAIRAAAQLGAQHQIAHMFVFSFPSLGNVTLYAMDAEHAGKSHEALAHVITHLFGALQPHARQGLRLEMLCHSLGNFVLSGAFTIMTSSHALLQTIYFRHAIHAAADVSADAFSQRDGLAQIVNLADEVEIYTNRWDKALAASFVLHLIEGDPDRLGAAGPHNFDMLPSRVNWIDCSQVAGNPLVDLGHGYYASAPAVIADLNEVLEGVAAGSIQPRHPAGAPNHFTIPVDDHTIALVRVGRGNSAVGQA